MNKDKKGFTLIELIVVVVILGVLMAVLVPQYIQYVERARQGIVEHEAGEFHRAASIALVEQAALGTELSYTQFTISAKCAQSPENTAFAANVRCGRITNWWLKSGSTASGESAKNRRFADSLVSILGLNKDSKLSSVTVSGTVPNSTNGATDIPTDDGLVFQILFKADGSVATEYYRNSYFVRLEGTNSATIKLEGTTIPFTYVS